jgi:shikimate kinase
MAPKPRPTLVQTVALIGMMGAGKTAIGRQLAKKLNAPFVDADKEIEKAAGCTIAEIFAQHGEETFRDGERRVIARLLEDPPCILATGGGAYMNEETRALMRDRALTVWLKADFETLWQRVSKRGHRPLLKTADPQGTLKRLMAEREPVYAHADLCVDSGEQTKDAMARKVMDVLRATQALEETDAK